MKLIVLISCMHQKDNSIICKSNIQTDAVVVNQCDKDEIIYYNFVNRKGQDCKVMFINTTERGLSRSRNMAIANAWGDICYICDDDEYLLDDYEDLITSAYREFPKTDIITFALIRKNYNYPETAQKVGIKQILKTSSVQTTFRRMSIVNNGIEFDPKMGSGSGNGGGEENKFLMDCRRKNLEMLYMPSVIAKVMTEDSLWFHGFDEKYFRDTFWAARRALGPLLAFLYVFYWCLFRSRNFDIKLNKFQMIKYSLIGFFEER